MMSFDLFNELLISAIDEQEAHVAFCEMNGITCTHIVQMSITYPAYLKLREIADDATIDRCLKKLQQERERRIER